MEKIILPRFRLEGKLHLALYCRNCTVDELYHSDRFLVEMFQNHGLKEWIYLRIHLIIYTDYGSERLIFSESICESCGIKQKITYIFLNYFHPQDHCAIHLHTSIS